MEKTDLILYSGGMDSTTLLYNFKDTISLAIGFNYNSKHNNKEFEYAKKNCDILNIPLWRIDISFLKDILKSNLFDGGGEIPEGHYEDSNMIKTVVPFRNGILLSIAVGIAESKGLKRVLIANHFGDHAIYPDCREDFISNFNKASKAGTYNQIEIYSPYNNLSKREIALIGKDLGIDYTLSYSCYKGGDIHCGRCATCVERIEALRGFDKTQYLDKEFAIKLLKEKENEDS